MPDREAGIHDARDVALRDIAVAVDDGQRAITRAVAAAKPGRRPMTILILCVVVVAVGTVIGLWAEQSQTNQQNHENHQTCLLRNANGQNAKTLYEKLARDAISEKYREDYTVAAQAIRFQDCGRD